MESLGDALLTISVQIRNLRSVSSRINAFLTETRRQTARTVSGFIRLERIIRDLGTSRGLRNFANQFANIRTEIGRTVGGFRFFDREIKKIRNKNLFKRSAFSESRKEVGKVIAALKKVCDLIDKVNRKRFGPQRGRPPAKNPGQGPDQPNLPGQPVSQDQVNNLRSFGFALRDAGRQLIFFGGALIASLAPAIVENARFEQAVANTISVLGDFSSVGREIATDALSDFFISLGERTEFTAVQIANAARQLALAGFELREIQNSLEDVVNLASAGNIELETAARIAANIGRAFQIDTDNFGRITDVLTAVATSSNTTVETIGESFRTLAPIASSVGQPLEEVTAALGLLGNSGVSSSRAGTGLSRFFSELLEDSEDLDEALRGIGSSFDAIDPNRVGLTDIVREFERLRDAGRIGTEFFFGNFDQRSARIISTLVTQGADAFDDLNKRAQESAGLAERIREQRIDTLAGDFQILISSLQSLLIEIGDTLNTSLRQVVQFVTDLTRRLTRFVEIFPALTAFVGRFIIVLGAAAIAVGALVTAIGAFVAISTIGPIIASLIGSFAALGAGATALTTTLTVLGGVLTAVFSVAGLAIITASVVALALAFTGLSAAIENRNIQSLQEYANALEDIREQNNETSVSIRKLQNQFELLQQIGTLNPLQIADLFGDESVINDSFVDTAVDDARTSFEEIQAKLATTDGNRFLGAFQIPVQARLVPDPETGEETLKFFEEFKNNLDTLLTFRGIADAVVLNDAGEEVKLVEVEIDSLSGATRRLAIESQIAFDILGDAKNIQRSSTILKDAFIGGLSGIQAAAATQLQINAGLRGQITLAERAKNIDTERLEALMAELTVGETRLDTLRKAESSNIRRIEQNSKLLLIEKELETARNNNASPERIQQLITARATQRTTLDELIQTLANEGKQRQSINSALEKQLGLLDEISNANEKARLENTDPEAAATFDTTRARDKALAENGQAIKDNAALLKANREEQALNSRENSELAIELANAVGKEEIKAVEESIEKNTRIQADLKKTEEQRLKDSMVLAENALSLEREFGTRIEREKVSFQKKRQAEADREVKAEAKKQNDIKRLQLTQAKDLAKFTDTIEDDIQAERDLREQALEQRVDSTFGTADSDARTNALNDGRILIENELEEIRKKNEESQNRRNKTAERSSQNRLSAEQNITNQIAQQVQSLSDAIGAQQFINRLQRGREAEAERTGLRALAASRRVRSLEQEIQQRTADPNQNVTNGLRNALDRARLLAGQAVSIATNAGQAGGAQDVSGTLENLVSQLRNGVQTVQFRDIPTVNVANIQNKGPIDVNVTVDADSLSEDITFNIVENPAFQQALNRAIANSFS